MADDAGHKAMLYFLEILMNSPAPLTISQLAGRFGSRNFTSEMRQAAGGNETGLKKFLQKYPSLFTVNGNLVNDHFILVERIVTTGVFVIEWRIFKVSQKIIHLDRAHYQLF